MRRNSRALHAPTLVLLLAVFVAAVAACSGSSDNKPLPQTTSGSGGGDGGSSNTGGSIFSTGGGSPLSLTVEPETSILDVSGAPATLTLTAKLSDGSEPTGVVWSNAPDLAGYVDGSGVFHADGYTAGTTTVTATLGELSAEATIEVRFAMVDNQGGVDMATQTALLGGGSADAAFRWLYPYDKTVFPRGLPEPELHLAGTAADAAYVKITAPNYSYEGFFGASNPTRIDLPSAVWQGLTFSAGASDDVQVSVTKISGGEVTGPASETWRIAQGSLKGVIYYNTYSSGGAVKRIRPGEMGQTFISGCPVCHSVASGGSVLAAGLSWTSGNPLDSGTFDLNPDGTVTPRYTDDDGRKFAFAGLTPDGSLALGSAVPPSGPKPRGLSGAYPSKLFDTATGAEVAAPSFTDVVSYAMTPNFAHDGKYVAFTNQNGNAKSLEMMAVDLTQSPPVFSNLQQLVMATDNVAAWPSFLPDSGAVLYHDGNAFDTQAGCSGPSYANIRLVDTATKTVHTLERLNGYDGGSFYLPFGEAEEANVNYEPTVLPVPVGGYYWVIFTSRRAYGNRLGPGGSDGGASKWGTCSPETPSLRKKLWVAAIDTSWQNSADPSHPAFYLPGQELDTGNMRAFAALEPCKEENDPCEYGFECCDGRQCLPTGEVDENGKPIKTCQEQEGCSPVGGSCETSADCCDPTNLCINGYCALPSPP